MKKKIKPSLKGVLGFTIGIASAASIIYVTPKIIKTVAAENNIDKIILDVKNVDEDTIKISLDKLEDIPKAIQFSIKLDGILPQKMEDGNIIINDLIKKDNTGNVITDYIYNESNNTIDVLITSEKSLKKNGNSIDIFELDIEKDSNSTTRKFTVLPTEDYEYKYVSNTNKGFTKAVEALNEELTINTSPTIERVNNNYIEIKVGEKIKLTSEELSKYILAKDQDQDEITFDVKNRDDISIQEFTSTTAGIYDIYVTAIDSLGAKSESLNIQIKVNEIDQDPIITRDGEELKDVTIIAGEIFNLMDGIKAVDDLGNAIDVVVTSDKALDFDPIEDTVYTITYTATDRLNRTTEKIILLTVKANNAPIIKGVKDHTLEVGDKFDPSLGVKVIDEDTDISLIIDSNVNTKIAGVYKVVYTATDRANKSTRVESIVVVNPKIVENNSIPVINANDVVIQLGDKFDNLAGITASDEEDGEIKDIQVVRDNVDVNVAGIYEVTYSVTDKAGAISTKTINVIVNDPPQIIAENKVLLLGERFEALSGITAIDKEDGDIKEKIEVIENNVNINEEGNYTVTYRVIDNMGGKSTKTITVTIKRNIVLAESIIINDKFNNLYLGSSKLLSATIDEKADIKDIEWTTSDTEIADIQVIGNDAMVIAKQEGQVTVTAKTKDGSNISDTITIDILDYKENVKDFIIDIIDTDVVTPVLGIGTEDSPLEMKVQNVTIEKFDEFILKFKGLDPVLIEKYEKADSIFYKIKVMDKSLITRFSNLFRTSTSYEGHVIIEISKSLDNSDYLIVKLDSILAVNEESGDKDTSNEESSGNINNSDEEASNDDSSSNEDKNDSENSSTILPITGKESILGYISVVAVAIGAVLYKKKK